MHSLVVYTTAKAISAGQHCTTGGGLQRQRSIQHRGKCVTAQLDYNCSRLAVSKRMGQGPAMNEQAPPTNALIVASGRPNAAPRGRCKPSGPHSLDAHQHTHTAPCQPPGTAGIRNGPVARRKMCMDVKRHNAGIQGKQEACFCPTCPRIPQEPRLCLQAVHARHTHAPAGQEAACIGRHAPGLSDRQHAAIAGPCCQPQKHPQAHSPWLRYEAQGSAVDPPPPPKKAIDSAALGLHWCGAACSKAHGSGSHLRETIAPTHNEAARRKRCLTRVTVCLSKMCILWFSLSAVCVCSARHLNTATCC